MQLIAEPLIAFHLPEVRKDVVPAPAWIIVVPSQEVVPFVVVGWAATNIHLSVNRRAPAENVSLRDVMHPSIQMLLRYRLMITHELAAVDHLENTRRHVQQWMPMRVSRLEQHDPRLSDARELGRGDGARGTATNNDEVIRT